VTEEEARKNRSGLILASEGVPINSTLPLIDNSEQAKRRNVEEVADRTMALLIVALKGEGLESGLLTKLISDLKPHFTAREQIFLDNPAPSQMIKIQFLWRYEAAWALLWALKYIEILKRPTAICDAATATICIRKRRRQEFIDGSVMRPITEILDIADLTYRYHWATRNAGLKNLPMPAGLNNSVIMERHYALNWLIGYCDEDWDSVTTDT